MGDLAVAAGVGDLASCNSTLCFERQSMLSGTACVHVFVRFEYCLTSACTVEQVTHILDVLNVRTCMMSGAGVAHNTHILLLCWMFGDKCSSYQ